MPQTDFFPFTNTKLKSNDMENQVSPALQKQLGAMEGEVREIQKELAAIKRGRIDLVQKKITDTHIEKETDALYETTKYLEDSNKYDEVSILRDELIRAKNTADEERLQRKKYEQKLNDLEKKLNNICGISSGSDVTVTKKPSDGMSSLKAQLRETKEEMDELKLTLSEKSNQLEDYRMKYLQAQQQVEEYKRQIDVIEFDHKQVSDQIQLEIQRMKIEFQEKLQELAPLPDMLKASQVQLQESKYLQKLAEENTQQISKELHRVKEKLVTTVTNFNQEKSTNAELVKQKDNLNSTLEQRLKEVEWLNNIIDELRIENKKLQESLEEQKQNQEELKDKYRDMKNTITELQADNARSTARGRERTDALRRNMASQISEMERALAHTRAQSCILRKERDEMRQRYIIQVNHLQENFNLAELRIRSLYEQVNTLKHSYAMILTADEADQNKITTVAF